YPKPSRSEQDRRNAPPRCSRISSGWTAPSPTPTNETRRPLILSTHRDGLKRLSSPSRESANESCRLPSESRWRPSDRYFRNRSCGVYTCPVTSSTSGLDSRRTSSRREIVVERGWACPCAATKTLCSESRE